MLAEGSIAGVMEGRKYNHAVRLHKIVYEAMMRLAWTGFLLWIQVNHGAEVHHLEEALKSISTFHDEVSHTASTLLLFQEYIGAIGNDNPWTAFRTSYLDMAEITLGLLGAAREGDWLLHLATIRAMIPWCVVYDKANYACFMSYYYATMLRLPLTTQRCTNSSCKVVSVSSLVTRIPSAVPLWIKPSRKQSTEIHRQQEAQTALA